MKECKSEYKEAVSAAELNQAFTNLSAKFSVQTKR
jgi:hypothetical protein